jgi:hypothetical protein
MTKAPRSKRPKSDLPPATQAAVEVLERSRAGTSAEMKRMGLTKFDPSSGNPLGLTLADWRTAFFEVLSLPLVASEVKRIADKLGTTVDVCMHGILAEGYHSAGQPLPPELREYLVTQDMPPAVRERFLKPSLS